MSPWTSRGGRTCSSSTPAALSTSPRTSRWRPCETAGRRKRKGQVLIAAGCLAERAADSLRRQIPSVDAVLGTRSWQQIPDVVAALAAQARVRRRPTEPERAAMPPGPRPSAYLKIADGCDSSCAFCVIPSIKGPTAARRRTR